MKKTLNVRIGNVAFTIDEDAFALLNAYLEDIRNCCEESVAAETVVDVENRIGDLFAERVGENEVVTIALVREAMNIIGSADNFGERRTTFTPQPEVKRRLYRSRDKVVGGVLRRSGRVFRSEPHRTEAHRLLLHLLWWSEPLGLHNPLGTHSAQPPKIEPEKQLSNNL